MDNSNIPQRSIHIDSSKLQNGQRGADRLPGDDTSKTRTQGVHRGRYKEKFQNLRERYDQVVALHEEYEKDLDLANARMRKLQAENDLLLDAINLAVPATPSLMHLTRPSPALYAAPAPHHMNGHSAPSANGRYPPVDSHDITPQERDRDYRDMPPEATAIGRS
ncbi:hypothetical protein M405DRAFT_822131 [Rhizopogon salebrosus TDB-379]|nr:hypothetical protein M405DRAFT_822131 [Rhizopogon salebrosus TDB-379]